MPASYTPGAAWPTQIVVNGNTLSVDSFAWDGVCDVIPTPSFTANGKMEYVPGMTSGTFTCGGTWNRVFNPNGAGITPGMYVTLLVRLNTNDYATDDDAIVSHFKVSGEANGPQKYEIDFVMNWAFTDFKQNIVHPI